MTITVLFFASLAEKIGKREIIVKYEQEDTVESITDRLIEEYPVIEIFSDTLLYAVNEEYADLTTPVDVNATLALIPPVSGG
ncbi:MAG: MoaD/ThiS family protein [Tepidiformaceae bacterium]